MFTVKYDPIKIDGEHIPDGDTSYKIWQKIKEKYPEDYEVAIPLS